LITRMEVVSSQPGAPDLPLGGFMPNDDPVQIRNIDGLGPVKSELSLTPFATGRGELYQGASTGKRNIILTLGLNPNWAEQTITSLRQLLYRYFMPEYWSTYRFISDELPPVTIKGVVESFEPNIFSQEPEIQVSVICPKPDFVDLDNTVVTGLTSDDVIGIDYTGTVNAGFVVDIESPDADSETGLTIANTYGDTTQVFSTNPLTITPSLYVEVNTIRATRHIYNVRYDDGNEYNILAKLIPNSDWPEFGPGMNTFSVVTGTPGLQWSLGYFNRYGGL
jgi:hypothetical protein